ncbi:hypothetical protein chiPu_0028559 [Chiloscyllium punctatum]|uniref:Uncharacterized protein n=1 Tax=Chiloscyllium punctatum TaxID=137246 RepID=A0A401TPK5_CHIPU|nr:hypothetical protein [Chiloscyllium punctatum]
MGVVCVVTGLGGMVSAEGRHLLFLLGLRVPGYSTTQAFIRWKVSFCLLTGFQATHTRVDRSELPFRDSCSCFCKPNTGSCCAPARQLYLTALPPSVEQLKVATQLWLVELTLAMVITVRPIGSEGRRE